MKSIYCRYWYDEDDKNWIGEATEYPIAVFGKTLEETRRNSDDAVQLHFEVLREMEKTNEWH